MSGIVNCPSIFIIFAGECIGFNILIPVGGAGGNIAVRPISDAGEGNLPDENKAFAISALSNELALGVAGIVMGSDEGNGGGGLILGGSVTPVLPGQTSSLK